MAVDWYYADAHNQQQGPVTGAALAAAYRAGTVRVDTLVWRDGLDGWVPLRQIAAQLGVIIVGAPPGPPPAPAAVGGSRLVKPASSSSVGLVIAIVLFGGLAVIGILAAIAIPAYQDYTLRSKVVVAMLAADQVKPRIADFYTSNGRCPENGENGFEAAEDYASNYVAKINIGRVKESKLCAMDVTLKGATAIDGKKLRLTLQEDGTWSVTSNLPMKFLPRSVREAQP